MTRFFERRRPDSNRGIKALQAEPPTPANPEKSPKNREPSALYIDGCTERSCFSATEDTPVATPANPSGRPRRKPADPFPAPLTMGHSEVVREVHREIRDAIRRAKPFLDGPYFLEGER